MLSAAIICFLNFTWAKHLIEVNEIKQKQEKSKGVFSLTSFWHPQYNTQFVIMGTLYF